MMIPIESKKLLRNVAFKSRGTAFIQSGNANGMVSSGFQFSQILWIVLLALLVVLFWAYTQN